MLAAFWNWSPGEGWMSLISRPSIALFLTGPQLRGGACMSEIEKEGPNA